MDGRMTPRVEWLVEQFKSQGVNVSASDQMPVPLWMKWLFLAPVAGLTALARTEAAELFRSALAQATLRAAITECESVARACDIQLPDDAVERQFTFALGLKPGNLASMHRDLLNRRRLELDALNGAVVRLGEAKGIPTPVHQTIYVALEPHAAGASG
jgi:2-dehydropantoate 2-reductase